MNILSARNSGHTSQSGRYGLSQRLGVCASGSQQGKAGRTRLVQHAFENMQRLNEGVIPPHGNRLRLTEGRL